MTTREMIEAELGRIPEERLGELYGLIRTFADTAAPASKPSLMSKLRAIQIEGPPDFAANLDQYLNGEKSLGEDVH
jgi:hypothetical protein